MSLKPALHELLISRQSASELKRKRKKAHRRGFWTQEDIDSAKREAAILALYFNWK